MQEGLLLGYFSQAREALTCYKEPTTYPAGLFPFIPAGSGPRVKDYGWAIS